MRRMTAKANNEDFIQQKTLHNQTLECKLA